MAHSSRRRRPRACQRCGEWQPDFLVSGEHYICIEDGCWYAYMVLYELLDVFGFPLPPKTVVPLR